MDAYIELILKKAEMLKSRLKHCASSELMLQAAIDVEDIIRAAKSLKEALTA